MKLLQTRRPQFGISHDRTSVDLTEKKTYDALKVELEVNVSASEMGWKIRRGSIGPELVNLANFRAP